MWSVKRAGRRTSARRGAAQRMRSAESTCFMTNLRWTGFDLGLGLAKGAISVGFLWMNLNGPTAIFVAAEALKIGKKFWRARFALLQHGLRLRLLRLAFLWSRSS